jgi:tetratricopeptide (TPR) repeat protein
VGVWVEWKSDTTSPMDDRLEKLRPAAIAKAPRLTPAWRPDPPGPLSDDPVPDEYHLPAIDYSHRPELALGVVLGGVAAAPFILFALPLWGFFLSFGAVFAGSRFYSAWRIRKWRDALARAFEHLERGDVERAERECREIALAQKHPLLRICSADFGYFALRRGDLRTALAIYSQAWENTALPFQLRANVAASLALTWAALGEVDAAARWLPSESLLITPAGAAVVRNRQSRYNEVLRLEMPETKPWQEPFIRHERRLLLLMQAFALDRLGESTSYIDAHLEAAQPAYPEEYDYLTQTWPELRDFLAGTAARMA